MSRFLFLLARNRAGATAAEFALVLPLLLIFLLGIIDAGRLMWTWNRAEKATQMGVRYAVVTEMVPKALIGYSFATQGGIPQGDVVPDTSFAGAKCTSNGTVVTCTCNVANQCGPSPLISTAEAADAKATFERIVGCMRRALPELTENRVQVDYDYSGLGFAGDPNGPDVFPLVRVGIRKDNMGKSIPFTPIFLFNQVTFQLPAFSAALTMEDGQGTTAECRLPPPGGA